MSLFSYETLLVTDTEGIREIAIHRPKALNALNQTVLRELNDLLQKTESDGEIGVVILTGQGERSFVAGADIAQMKTFTPKEAEDFAALGHAVFAKLEALPQPVIAAVNGFALGGGTELALACDFLYASEKAVFGQPEVKLGLIPGFGGTQRLIRKIPQGYAREMILTGETISAQEAFRIGLVNRLLPPADLMDAARATAKLLLQRSSIAITQAKRAMLEGYDLSLQDGCALEIRAFGKLFASDHPSEGTSAFLEKRPPRFSKPS